MGDYRNGEPNQQLPLSRCTGITRKQEKGREESFFSIKKSSATAQAHRNGSPPEICLRKRIRKIRKCLRGVYSQTRGEVAERLKAAVCYGCQGLRNGPEIHDFRPVFYSHPG